MRRFLAVQSGYRLTPCYLRLKIGRIIARLLVQLVPLALNVGLVDLLYPMLCLDFLEGDRSAGVEPTSTGTLEYLARLRD